jgi:hypothetical protein
MSSLWGAACLDSRSTSRIMTAVVHETRARRVADRQRRYPDKP